MTLSFWLDSLARVLSALWVGAAFAFAAWYAPHAFRTLPSRAEAAAFTRPVRERVERLGAWATVLVVLALYALGARDGWWALGRGRLAAALVAALAWHAHVWLVRPALERRFDRRGHEASRALWAVAMAGALVVAVL